MFQSGATSGLVKTWGFGSALILNPEIPPGDLVGSDTTCSNMSKDPSSQQQIRGTFQKESKRALAAYQCVPPSLKSAVH